MKSKKVSITDFNDNISHYIAESKHTVIHLTKRGITVATLCSPKEYEKAEKYDGLQ